MNQLQPIQRQINNATCYSARAVYDWLGFHPSAYARWCKRHIIDNECLRRGEDYEFVQRHVERPNPNPTQDFAITAETAKAIAIAAGTKRGAEIRDYFLKCEETVQQIKGRVSTRDEERRAIRKKKQRPPQAIYKYLDGEDVEAIAEKFGVSPGTVNDYLRFEKRSEAGDLVRLYATAYANVKGHEIEARKRLRLRLVDRQLKQLNLDYALAERLTCEALDIINQKTLIIMKKKRKPRVQLSLPFPKEWLAEQKRLAKERKRKLQERQELSINM